KASIAPYLCRMEGKCPAAKTIFTPNSTLTVSFGFLDWGLMGKRSLAVEISLDLNSTLPCFLGRFRFRLTMISMWEARLTSKHSASARLGQRLTKPTAIALAVKLPNGREIPNEVGSSHFQTFWHKPCLTLQPEKTNYLGLLSDKGKPVREAGTQSHGSGENLTAGLPKRGAKTFRKGDVRYEEQDLCPSFCVTTRTSQTDKSYGLDLSPISLRIINEAVWGGSVSKLGAKEDR